MDITSYLEDPGVDVLCERRMRRTGCNRKNAPVFRDAHNNLEYRAWECTLKQQRFNALRLRSISVDSSPSAEEVFSRSTLVL